MLRPISHGEFAGEGNELEVADAQADDFDIERAISPRLAFLQMHLSSARL